MKLGSLIISILLSLAAFSFLPAQKFYPDDPIWEMPEIPIPKPQAVDRSEILDFLENEYLREPEGPVPHAQNVNTLGEVPDSSWFTNRIGLRPMSLEELARGPDRSDGPDMSSPWIITSPKMEGDTPGFVIEDGRGDTYFLKVDPAGYPQLTTSAEVIATKFFYAFGYHVPENYLVFIRPENLQIGRDTEIETQSGKTRKMTREDLNRMLERTPRMEDGSIQVVASLAVSGEPLGEFKYWGVRPDDPNDIIPHQHRRELRGMRLFAAWLNHVDADAVNTLDTFIGDEEAGFVRHYLLDFGSTLGSGGHMPQMRRSGHEAIVEWTPILKRAISFGIWEAEWQNIAYPHYPSIGRFEARHFKPDEWKPHYLNPAFSRMTLSDALWATRTVMRFNDRIIRALVETGQLVDARAEAYLVNILIERRDRIVQHYLSLINPLDEFRISNTGNPNLSLEFTNLGVAAEVGTAESYEYQWFHFDNQRQVVEPLGAISSSSTTSIPFPGADYDYLMVRIRTLSSISAWKKNVNVYIRTDPTIVVGVEREESLAYSLEPTAYSLFDGQTLANWEITNFGGQGSVYVEDGALILERGDPMTGVTWSGGDLPTVNYEITLEAARLSGSDFFCGLTFPVNDSSCSLIVGGWGGGLVGLSSLDGADASENETMRVMSFREGQSYRIHLKVTEGRIEAWIDDEKVVDVATEGRQISIRPEVYLSQPLGFATWVTTAGLRNIRIKTHSVAGSAP